ncbi:MAG: transcriptional regulator, partial [Desulfobacteraceae bacterium]
DGLSGEEISLGARILAVADVYDALVSDRPYRTGMDRERVIGMIKEEAGKQFDPRVVEALLEVIGQEGVER